MKYSFRRLINTLIPALIALGLGACATVPVHTTKTSFSFDPPVKQPKNRANVKMKLSTTAQRLYIVEGDEVLLATPVTVGTPDAPTPMGIHTVRAKQKYRRRASQPGAGYPMTYWVEFYGPAYGFHWGFIKPQPGTHGCVRMPLNAAKKVFDLVQVGNKVEIAKTQPWDDTIGKSLPILDDGALPNPPMSYMLSQKVFTDQDSGKMWNF